MSDSDDESDPGALLFADHFHSDKIDNSQQQFPQFHEVTDVGSIGQYEPPPSLLEELPPPPNISIGPLQNVGYSTSLSETNSPPNNLQNYNDRNQREYSTDTHFHQTKTTNMFHKTSGSITDPIQLSSEEQQRQKQQQHHYSSNLHANTGIRPSISQYVPPEIIIDQAEDDQSSDDGEAPPSLMIELTPLADQKGKQTALPRRPMNSRNFPQPPTLHTSRPLSLSSRNNPKEFAMRSWQQIDNLDAFLIRVCTSFSSLSYLLSYHHEKSMRLLLGEFLILYIYLFFLRLLLNFPFTCNGHQRHMLIMWAKD